MGCFETSPEKQQDMGVSSQLERDKLNQNKIQKLLFLGSGGSGKSTFFKQLQCIHGKGFNEKERMMFREHISSQIIEQMYRSVECIPFYNEQLSDNYPSISLSKEGQESANFFDDFEFEPSISKEIAHHINILWNEDAIKQVYKNRSLFQIDDSSEYFFDEILRIGTGEEFIPTDNDILLVRYRTTGVIEKSFNIGGSIFNIFDVGGQKNERKKWIHCFENVTAVIFVASLSCYDEVTFEDESVNAMHDSLKLFEDICHLQWFCDTPIILFLNKKDLFHKKINIVPLSVCFPEFDQPKISNEQYLKDAKLFIKNKFEMVAPKNIDDDDDDLNSVHTHITTATDTNNVKTIFNEVQQILVTAGLARNNLY